MYSYAHKYPEVKYFGQVIYLLIYRFYNTHDSVLTQEKTMVGGVDDTRRAKNQLHMVTFPLGKMNSKPCVVV